MQCVGEDNSVLGSSLCINSKHFDTVYQMVHIWLCQIGKPSRKAGPKILSHLPEVHQNRL